MLIYSVLNHLPKKILDECKIALNSNRISKVRKQLEKINNLPKEIFGKTIRIGIIRTFSLETQIDFLKLAINLIPSRVDIYLADIDSIEEEIFNQNSKLFIWKPDIVLILWRLEELIPKFYSNPQSYTLRKYKNLELEVLKRIHNIVKTYSKITSSPLVISTMPFSQNIDIFEINHSVSIRKLTNKVNSLIFELSSENITILDFNHWQATIGNNSFDQKMNFYARQIISSQCIGSFANFIARTIKTLIVSPCKVLALDLDNVLWGGILGEDGIENLQIGNNFPGNIYTSIQEFVIKLKKRGILLVLLSKNNENEVLNAFKQITEMKIKIKDFVTTKINWKEKYNNIREISEELNLALEHFVFVDDQSFEQEQMIFNLPQVNVLKVSNDPISILNSLQECHFFDQSKFSQEDKIRELDYKAEFKRKKLKKTIDDTTTFLKTIKLKAKISKLKKIDVSRAHQMIMRINQFNLRTQRHTENHLRELLNNPKNLLLKLSLSDKYGDQGVVGFIIGKYIKKETLFVDTFILSCRVLGRSVEKSFWFIFIEQALREKIKTITSEYIPSEKNSQVANLYKELGLKFLKSKNKIDFYKINIPYLFKKPDWIDIQ